VLYFLSASVEPPAADVAAGLVTVTFIHSSKERPPRAYVAAPHRGWWFYIAAADQSSKATFSLLNILFWLQSASGKGKSPLLTLPVGGP